jgi:3-hydroxymyristoyl/3-hydroxydecanoyl-(acyl carrier protein) dehydratase
MPLTSLEVQGNHPAYAGHFPGNPVLPAVVLLDAALHALEAATSTTGRCWHVSGAKFPSAVRPGEPLTLEHEELPNGAIRFWIRSADRLVAHGSVNPAARGELPSG